MASGASEVPVEAVRFAVDGLDGVEVVDSLIVAIGYCKWGEKLLDDDHVH